MMKQYYVRYMYWLCWVEKDNKPARGLKCRSTRRFIPLHGCGWKPSWNGEAGKSFTELCFSSGGSWFLFTVDVLPESKPNYHSGLRDCPRAKETGSWILDIQWFFLFYLQQFTAHLGHYLIGDTLTDTTKSKNHFFLSYSLGRHLWLLRELKDYSWDL